VTAANTQKSDIPLPAAVALLVGVGLVLATINSGYAWSDIGLQIEDFFERHGGIITISVLAIFLNVFVVQTFAARYLGYRRQGNRLRDLTGTRKNPARHLWVTTISVTSLSAAYSVLLYYAREIYGVVVSPLELPDIALYLIILNMALATAIVTHWFWTAWHQKKSRIQAASTSSQETTPKLNMIILGATPLAKDSADEQPVVINRKALNGNILVTGSIGSGKTQGTILPYFEQIISSSDPVPSIVAIDPKGTFIKDAFKIAKGKDQRGRVLHLCLGGSVSFNPIYVEGALTNGRFLDVAQMIRTAAINFSGRPSGDSHFWEQSAFNLTKNSLVYVAAVHGYYTLNDLYAVMNDAVDDNAAPKLEATLRENKFTSEEAVNIRHALSYFSQEFHNFDPKVKTGILATATSFLNQFQEFQASQIFCPPKNRRTIQSMDEIVDGGLFLFFDIDNPGLARAVGTFIKLHYQQSVLRRLTDENRGKDRAAVLIIDEYQDVVSSGYGSMLGDDRFLAKGREANAITIAATQSLSSLENSLGRKEAARELCQNFRTRIALHSTDLLTINTFKELVGEEDREKKSHSYSELSNDTKKNYVTGSFEADKANISESVSTALHRESIVTGKEFSKLGAFEALSLIYDGFETNFIRLYLKPHFLSKERKTHAELKKILAAAVAGLLLTFSSAQSAFAFPNVCDVVKQPAFSSCLEYQVGSCTCPGYPPRPCASFSYYVPDTYVELAGERGSTKFRGLPGVETQLSNLSTSRLPYGTEGNDFEAFQARTLPVPFASTIFESMPCSSGTREATCFGAMSEHLGSNWSTGAPDLRQPSHLLWAANPKACLLLGAARSLTGGGEPGSSSGSAMCSVSMETLTQYPPSAHSACNGWGIFYPRIGMYDGPSQTTAALMVGSRMKSLSTEVFQSAPSSSDEKWQMILPSGSQCFREGQNVGFLETAAMANDRGRLQGRLKDYLFVVWRRVSCCKDYDDVASAAAVLAGMSAACQGLGGVN
jgi:type IV secretory pathway TraG/TraD family ATPase VirD4